MTDPQPRMNIHHDAENDTVVAAFELPGLTREDITVVYKEGRILVKSKEAGEEEQKNWSVRERLQFFLDSMSHSLNPPCRGPGCFARALHVSQAVDV